MDTPASIARHPIHPMLITIPIGLWIFSLVCDFVVFFADTSDVQLLWFTLAYYSMAGGIVGALLAAVPGLIDLLSLKNRRLRNIALTHMVINLVIVAMYAVNLWLRNSESAAFATELGLSVVSILLLLVSGWLGGELVHVHGVAVSPVPASVSAETIAPRETGRETSATTFGPT
jgi:uncharacterized membrane protein